MISAFGVEHQIAKADGEPIRARVRRDRNGVHHVDFGTSRGQDFRRGFRGGLLSSHIAAGKSPVVPIPKKARRTARAFARQAEQRAALASAHPQAVVAGARTGRATAYTARNARVVVPVALGAAAIGTTMAADEVQARRRAAAQGTSRRIGKALVSPGSAYRYGASASERAAAWALRHPKAAVVGAGSALAATSVGTTELERRHANRGGAELRPTDPYRHPKRSQAAVNASRSREQHALASEATKDAHQRARTAPSPLKAERAKITAERGENAKNYLAWRANAAQAVAEHGSARRAKKAGVAARFDRNRQYAIRTDPIRISTQGGDVSKSAFGIDHGEIAKASRKGDARHAAEIGGAVGVGYGSAHGVPAGARKAVDTYRDSRNHYKFSRKFSALGAAVNSPRPAIRELTRRGAPVAAGGAAGIYALRSIEGKRSGDVNKAFDSERQRHRRQQAYEGAATGGAVAAGASAAKLGRAAYRRGGAASLQAAESRATHIDVQRDLHRMAQPTASPGSLSSSKQSISHTAKLHREAIDQNREAIRLTRSARRLRGAARTSAVTSAALGAAAYGIHRHDENAGRSYGYR